MTIESAQRIVLAIHTQPFKTQYRRKEKKTITPYMAYMAPPGETIVAISSPWSKNAWDWNLVKIEILIASCCTYKDLSWKQSDSWKSHVYNLRGKICTFRQPPLRGLHRSLVRKACPCSQIDLTPYAYGRRSSVKLSWPHLRRSTYRNKKTKKG